MGVLNAVEITIKVIAQEQVGKQGTSNIQPDPMLYHLPIETQQYTLNPNQYSRDHQTAIQHLRYAIQTCQVLESGSHAR